MNTGLTRRDLLSSAGPSGAAAKTPRLELRPLGKTGLRLTTVGFGCMITSDPSVVERALDSGINYFDTARVYQNGNNERMVGAALRKGRDKIYISSKSVSRTKAALLEDIDTTLKEIGTDHIDIWYLHNYRNPAEIKDELLEAQEIARKQGKIRFKGISTHLNQAAVMRAALAKKHFDVFLTSYNFAMDQALDPVLAEAKQAGVGIVAMKVMAGGYREMPFYPTTPAWRARMKQEGALLAALKWVLKNKNVDTTIPSMVDQDQLEENLRAMAEPYTPADEKLLTAQLDRIGPILCRMCNTCDGQCRQGLPVADMLRYLMYADGYRQFALGRQEFLNLSEETHAVRCKDCPGCTVECPNGVRVAHRLRRAQELFA
jgi:aryl-alcohol dehydrogenase-like predicted oxidoreductase